MKILTIIQARMGSTRLNGKVLMKLGNSTALDYVVRRCKMIQGVDRVVVATSDLEIDRPIEEWCKYNNVDCVRGSESDVLSRFIKVVKTFEADYIIRVTADCPFVDYEMAQDMIQLVRENQVDVIDVKGDLPRGVEVELISTKALKRIDKITTENKHREHVTYYAYEFPSEFTRLDYNAKSRLQNANLRITLDTELDYKMLVMLAKELNNPLIRTEDVILYLEKNVDIALINKEVQQKKVE